MMVGVDKSVSRRAVGDRVPITTRGWFAMIVLCYEKEGKDEADSSREACQDLEQY